MGFLIPSGVVRIGLLMMFPHMTGFMQDEKLVGQLGKVLDYRLRLLGQLMYPGEVERPKLKMLSEQT
jgi:hypothetical protein